jgi:prepilin-type N-terminal cleavage/methylation domain-containing protein
MRVPSPRPRPRGMTLLEVIIALGVFGIAALALVKTMHLMGETTIESRTLREVTQGLESIIDEYGKVPGLQELDEEVKAGRNGVAYRVVIRPVEGLRNKEGRELQGFFSISATAKWKDNGRPMELSAETIRFVNAFVPFGG